jgi:hypothetical protein
MKAISLFNYPRTTNATEAIVMQSRMVKGELKKGRLNPLYGFVDATILTFLNTHIPKNAILIPIPKSAPLVANAVWPALNIANYLVASNIGKAVEIKIFRHQPVQPSHLCASSADRPTVKIHKESMRLGGAGIFNPEHIVLVDDVLTAGRTATACRLLLESQYPNIQINVFTPMVTESFNDVNALIEPQVRTVNYYPLTGRTFVER